MIDTPGSVSFPPFPYVQRIPLSHAHGHTMEKSSPVLLVLVFTSLVCSLLALFSSHTTEASEKIGLCLDEYTIE